MVSVQAVADTALQTLPGNEIPSIAFPGNSYGSPHHFVVWLKGATPLTSKLATPVLVEGATGTLSTIAPMPWYLKALELSRPLTFW